MVYEILFWTVLTLVAYTYVGYVLLVRLLSLFFTKTARYDSNYTPKVSMIIAAYNEERIIEEKIKNCQALDYTEGKLTILIGSDGSTDATTTILKKYANGFIKPFIFKSRRGKASVLNDLVQYAESEIIVFSDANTMYQPDAIRHLVKYFVDNKIGGVCGKLELFIQNDSSSGKGETLYWNYENLIKKYESNIKTVFGANGAIYAIRRALYENLPESYVIMDDFLVPLNIVAKGYVILFEAEAIGREATSSHLKGEFARKIRIGAANFNSLREIWPLLLPTKGFVAFGLWSHKIIRWFVPFLLLIIFISNIFISSAPFYKATMIFQVLFYTTAIIGYFLNNKMRIPKLFLYCVYFCTINLALAIGFFKCITKSQKPAWARVERG